MNHASAPFVLSAEDVAAARGYRRACRVLNLLTIPWLLAVGFWLIVSDAFVLFDSIADFFGSKAAALPLIVFLVALVMIVAGIPVAVAWNWIGRRYGVSNQSATQLVYTLLFVLIGGTIFVTVAAYLFMLALQLGQLVAWSLIPFILSLVTTALSTLALRYLPPIEFESPDLHERLRSIARAGGMSNPIFVRLLLKAQTRAAVAGVAPVGGGQRIVLSDTLLERFPPEEIAVIVAHEAAHVRNGDRRILLAVRLLMPLIGAAAAVGIITLLGAFVGWSSLGGALLILGAAFGTWWAVANLGTNAILRWREARADLGALDATGLADTFISAMSRLAALNLENPSPHPVFAYLFASHPPIAARIAMAERWKAQHAVAA